MERHLQVLARNDMHSLLRQALHYGSLAIGVGSGLYGIEHGIELLLRTLPGVPVGLSDIVGFSASYDFASPITLGLLVVGVNGIWLRMAARRQTEGLTTTFIIGEAITAALFAVVFWFSLIQM